MSAEEEGGRKRNFHVNAIIFGIPISLVSAKWQKKVRWDKRFPPKNKRLLARSTYRIFFKDIFQLRFYSNFWTCKYKQETIKH